MQRYDKSLENKAAPLPLISIWQTGRVCWAGITPPFAWQTGGRGVGSKEETDDRRDDNRSATVGKKR